MIKALRRARTSPGEAIFFPHEGTIFNSREEARDFYNLYSWEKGFGVRFGRGKKNDSKYQTKLDIVCSCEVNMKNETSIQCSTHTCREKCHMWEIHTLNYVYEIPLAGTQQEQEVSID